MTTLEMPEDDFIPNPWKKKPFNVDEFIDEMNRVYWSDGAKRALNESDAELQKRINQKGGE